MLPNEEQAAIHRDRAYRLFDECRVKDALLELKESLKHDTRDAASLRLLGQIFGEAGYHEPAISYAERAVAEDYSVPESWMTLVTLYARLGGPYLDLALEQAEMALSVLGDNADIFYLQGNIYGQKGEKKVAVEYLRKATEMQPDHAHANNDLKALGA
jgi:tetratricopeptide (TPR) repeat protein